MRCDEIFQEIQRLEQQRQGLERERELVRELDLGRPLSIL